MIRLLLIGNGNHQFILNLSAWLKKRLKGKLQLDILSYQKVLSVNLEYYDNVFDVGLSEPIQFGLKVPVIRRLIRRFVFVKAMNSISTEYDFYHFHFIDSLSGEISKVIRKRKKHRIVFSIWGSDFYRLKRYNMRSFRNTCMVADQITFTNQETLNSFQGKFKWNKKNLSVIHFGLQPLENLRKLSSKTKAKAELNWPKNKIAITIGYNCSPEQQHLKILAEFAHDNLLEFKDRIILVLPLTYQGTALYKDTIHRILGKMPYQFVTYDDFLSDEEVGKIRYASDIMVQLQTTDQFSGSMQEHLFAENVVITGSWLPYGILKEKGIRFFEIDRIEDLKNKLCEILGDFERLQSCFKSNRNIIMDLSSWGKVISSWVDLYK